MKIRVTQKIINKANSLQKEFIKSKSTFSYERERSCPVSLALEEAGFQNPYVDTDFIRINGKTLLQPRSVYQFIRLWDSKHKGALPFNFYLKNV